MTSELLQVFFYNTYSHRADFVVQSYKKSILYRNKTDLICSWNGK